MAGWYHGGMAKKTQKKPSKTTATKVAKKMMARGMSASAAAKFGKHAASRTKQC